MDKLTTPVFMSGNSQAVRIPAPYRLDTDRVRIFRNEGGDLVLQPLRPGCGAALLKALEALHKVDDQFVCALEAARDSPLPMQERNPL